MYFSWQHLPVGYGFVDEKAIIGTPDVTNDLIVPHDSLHTNKTDGAEREKKISLASHEVTHKYLLTYIALALATPHIYLLVLQCETDFLLR